MPNLEPNRRQTPKAVPRLRHKPPSPDSGADRPDESRPPSRDRGAFFRALLAAGGEPEAAYNAAEEVRSMAGENAVAQLGARIETLGARIDTVHAELGARIDAVHAKLGARIETLGARIDAVHAELGARIDALDSRLGALEERVRDLAGIVAEHGRKLEALVELSAGFKARFESVDARLRAMWALQIVIVVMLTTLLAAMFGILVRL